MNTVYGECSSVGRASGCGSEGRGFDPHHSPHIQKYRTHILEYARYRNERFLFLKQRN